MGADYPSETFRVLKDKEMRAFGEYRTQRLILREFDRMDLAEAEGETYVSLLNPPPGGQAMRTYSAHGIIRDDTDAYLSGLVLTVIRQENGLPRCKLTQILALASRPDLQDRFVDAPGVSALRLFAQAHPGIFDGGRLPGNRIQQWLRHFESLGVIRLNAGSDQIEIIQAAAMPNFVLLDDRTARVAAVLVHAAAQAFAGMALTDEEQVADPPMKQA